jgi:hypothetical protein
MRIAPAIASAVFLLGFYEPGARAKGSRRSRFILKQNIQDRDLEVKFEAVGSSVGLKTLKAVAQAGCSF